MAIRSKTRVPALALVAAVLLSVAPASSHEALLALGEVRALGPQESRQLTLFRSVVEESFKTLELPRPGDGGSYVLSATLAHFQSVRRRDSHTTTCVVTATLRDRKAGSLRALLKGSAKMHESGPTPDGNRLTMEAAVRSALSHVQEVIR